ncbi:endonuclease VII domain-containing protein [Streptomyces sp. ET3-23]|uniref:endonuclease domain-containing protein n=1 Tax=Streptomyces sp. ET3-23 TaxID=2885643 RepID=UPI001D10C954|nr:endonuclease VII domain-containing protein [Streptomyces sp. ET3-23]
MECEECRVPYRFGVRGRVRGHCLSCSVVARQARRYNLKASDVYAILELQGHVCALCERGPRGDEETSYWHIDHAHECCQPWDFICGGCVRGLLCAGCNMRGVAWYETLPNDQQDWERMNSYLANPPARRLRLAGTLRFRDLAAVRSDRRRYPKPNSFL